MDFEKIASRGDSQADAFEELCCQLALADVSDPFRFRRVRGDGGDGGVECVWTDSQGGVHGWQVKYIFDIDQALKKATASLATARKRYPSLIRYTVCLPFDLSGAKGRTGRGKSQQDKFDAFKTEQEAAAAADGQSLSIELWSGFQIRDRLLRIDGSGGYRRFWFDAACLHEDWFSDRLASSITLAGPRYNPKLHTGHALDDAFSALGDTPGWRSRLDQMGRELAQAASDWRSRMQMRPAASAMIEPFPTVASDVAHRLLASLTTASTSLENRQFAEALTAIRRTVSEAADCERVLAIDLEERFEPGAADSVPFRQFQAEYMCRFPAGHLDACRDLQTQLAELITTLDSPAMRAASERTLLLVGPAGIGKTHGICDAARRRRESGLLTLIVFGSQFSSKRSIWECLSAALALDGTWSRDVLLDALDAAGAIYGRVLVCVDALDERSQRTRWRDDLPEFIQAVNRRPNIALCMSVRDGYQKQIIREDVDLPTFVHPGFSGAVFDACSTFFNHFDLTPPIGPLLEPEFSNPLFLLTLCRTLQARGLTEVPSGWQGTKRILEKLLAAHDDGLWRKEPGVGTRSVTNAMLVLADALPEGGSLPWTKADEIVQGTVPASQRGRIQMLDHLVGIDLLRILPGESDGWGNTEDHVDIAFSRLRHHLLAEKLTPTDSLELRDRWRVAALDDAGLAEALALALPEKGYGEIVALATNSDERGELLESWTASLPWRSGESLDEGVDQILREAIEQDPELALDAMVYLALRLGHPYDHRYFHGFLMDMSMPQRDARLCGYLHLAFERSSPASPIRRAIDAAWTVDPGCVSRSLREAWCVVLSWCCAAADRRVRDHATKAAVRLTQADPGVWSDVVARFSDVDDDAVLERVLCASYGALVRNPVADALCGLAQAVRDHVIRRPSGMPRHALIRGHAQMIGEWTAHRHALPANCSVADFQPSRDIPPADLQIPSEEELRPYASRHDEYPGLHGSVMSEHTGDFAKYTMHSALSGTDALIGLKAAGRWILGEVMNMGYSPQLHAPYDRYMRSKHGGGRGRPVWAERIGKKYQWIALNRLVGALEDLAYAKGEEPKFLCERLRDIDPTVLQQVATWESALERGAPWWEPVMMDFEATSALTDEQWIAQYDDYPDPRAFVGALIDPARPQQRWRLLDAHFSWRDRGSEDTDGTRRDVWMMIKGYLVPRANLEKCWEALRTSDLFGRWMAEGLDIENGPYIGEYPWASPFPEVREKREGRSAKGRRLATYGVRPTANDLRRLPDSWQTESISLSVPSAELLEATSTRWDGDSGFRTEDGQLVFRDPGFTAPGPAGLWMDADELTRVQDELDVAVVWTAVTERVIIDPSYRSYGDEFPGAVHRSMVMRLDGDEVTLRRAAGEHILPDRTCRTIEPE